MIDQARRRDRNEIVRELEHAGAMINGSKVKCPYHDDHSPSGGIFKGDDGAWRYKCQACDVGGDVYDLESIRMKQPLKETLANQKHKEMPEACNTPSINVLKTDIVLKDNNQLDSYCNRNGWTVARYFLYEDKDRQPFMLVARLEKPDGKSFRQFRKAEGGWTPKAPEKPWKLYKLPDIAEYELVVIVEGEKTCEALWSVGIAATTNPGGAGKAKHTDLSVLAGKSIILWSDNDPAGKKHMDEVEIELASLTPQPKVRRIDLADMKLIGPDGLDVDMPVKGDATDWVECFTTIGNLDNEMAATTLKALFNGAPEVTFEPFEGSSMTNKNNNNWPDPKSLESIVTPTEAFDDNLLPESFRQWIADIAHRMQCPIDYPAVSVMVAFSSIVGRNISIRPKAKDDWTVIPNLWGALIGRPSMMKSPPMKEVLKPLLQLNKKEYENYKEKMTEYKSDQIIIKPKKSVLKSQIMNKMKNGNDSTEEESRLKGLSCGVEPQRRQYLTSDSTSEALCEILKDNNSACIMIYRDELIGILKYLERHGQETARSFYLEGWEGNGSYTQNRITREPVHIDGVCISLLGSIQPSVMAEYIDPAIRGGSGDDGLVQRFQLAVYPDDPGEWRYVDELPDSEARKKAYAVFDRIAEMDGNMFGGSTDHWDEDSVPYLRFTPEAQEIFASWMVEKENRLKRSKEVPAIEAHLTKFRSLVPSLALLIHIADEKDGDVGVESLNRALKWETYLKSHARKIYANGQKSTARLIADKILDGKLESHFNVRMDLKQKGWAGLTDSETIDKALEQLAELDWLKILKNSTGGRAAIECDINPKVFNLP